MFICRFSLKNVQIPSIDDIRIDEIMIIAQNRLTYFMKYFNFMIRVSDLVAPSLSVGMTIDFTI